MYAVFDIVILFFNETLYRIYLKQPLIQLALVVVLMQFYEIKFAKSPYASMAYGAFLILQYLAIYFYNVFSIKSCYNIINYKLRRWYLLC